MATLRKLVYLLWEPPGSSPAEIGHLLRDRCGPELLEAGAVRLQLNIADELAQVRSPAPKVLFDDPYCGQVNLWVAEREDRLPLEDVLRHRGFDIAGYLVDESIYTDYGDNRHGAPRDWPDGRRSPGILAVTLMERPKRLSRREWIGRWHGRQSPLSESMQPRSRYVRNRVLQPLTAGAPPFEGIVEEAYPSAEHVTNPYLFYGAANTLALAKNMTTMLGSVVSFLDLWRIRTIMMSEYFIRTDSSITP